MINDKFPKLNISVKGFLAIFAATLLLTLNLPNLSSVTAQVTTPSQLECKVNSQDGVALQNQAHSTYEDGATELKGLSNLINSQITLDSTTVEISSLGITDSAGNLIVGIGTISDGLVEVLQQQGFDREDARTLSNIALAAFIRVSSQGSIAEVVSKVKAAMVEAVDPSQTSLINALAQEDLVLALAGLSPTTLNAMGLSEVQSQEISASAQSNIRQVPETAAFNQSTNNIFEQSIQELTSETRNSLVIAREALHTDLDNVRRGQPPSIKSGDTLNYRFRLRNQGKASAEITIPDAATLQQTGLKGAGQVRSVSYTPAETNALPQAITSPTPITLASQESIVISSQVEINNISAVANESISLSLNLQGKCGDDFAQQTTTIVSVPAPLTDPFGQLTGCQGELLASYEGFSVGLFEPDPSDPTGGILGAIPLTVTELPDNPNNNIPAGLAPNIENSNPFFLTNSDEGRYNFLFDMNRGQLDFGRNYILLVNPPNDSAYSERRVRLTIGEQTGNIVSYTATSLDGRPMSVTDPLGRTTVEGTFVLVEDAERFGLDLAVLDLTTSVCQAQEVRIDKSGDRVATEPGDVVLYRLSVRNLSTGELNNIEITDQLPAGINLIKDSVRGQLEDQTVAIDVDLQQRTATFTPPGNLELGQNQVLNIIYGVRVTPDAVRGSGRNSALIRGTIAGREVRDGPAVHRLEIRPGIISDCGTLIGRVFVDKNFDGEQQSGEPGVPNAVIFLQSGNRITTDADGLFSLANVLPGYHTGVLDPLSIPEYNLAPNLYVSERNSSSRLVRISAGSMARMNFALTPKAQEERNDS